VQQWFADVWAEATEDTFKAVMLGLLLAVGVVEIAWPRVRDLFDPVVKREYGHVVAVDGGAWWKGNEDPMQTRELARMPSGEELLFAWVDGTIGLHRDIKRQVFTRGGWLINQTAPKINADPHTQQMAIAQMKARYFRYWLPQPKSLVVVHRKSGRYQGKY